MLVIVAACGSSQPAAERRPEPPPVVDEDTGPLPTPRSDPNEPGPASVVSQPDAAPATISGQPSYVVATIDNTKALASAPDMESTTENGVTVIRTNHPMWCGNAKGICVDSAADCKSQYGACGRAADYSCVSFSSRTSGTDGTLCVHDYGVCQQARGVLARNPERTNLGDCVIVRHKS